MKIFNTTHKGSNKICFHGLSNCLFAAICILLLSGCSNYQYITIDSNLYKNENKEFFVSNDTLSIKYSFAGENLLISVTIYNKLLKPVYIDWTRTNVIMNGGQLNESFYHEQQISYIAPQSFATIQSNPLLENFIPVNKQDSLNYLKTLRGENGNWVIYSFNEEITPVYFRSIIALTTDENLTSPMFIDNSFWVSQLFQTSASPLESFKKSSNQFYIRKTTGVGSFLGWTSAIAAVVLLSKFGTGE